MLGTLLTTSSDVEIIQGLVENLGVPVVIIIAMGAFIWFMYTQNRKIASTVKNAGKNYYWMSKNVIKRK